MILNMIDLGTVFICFHLFECVFSPVGRLSPDNHFLRLPRTNSSDVRRRPIGIEFLPEP